MSEYTVGEVEFVLCSCLLDNLGSFVKLDKSVCLAAGTLNLFLQVLSVSA